MPMPTEDFGIIPFPIIGPYNVQRFRQFGPEDTANFFLVKGQNTKRDYAMYPTLGRAHISYLGGNQLIFSAESRGIFKTVKYSYFVVGNTIYQVDNNYNVLNISGSKLQTSGGNIFFAFLVVNKIVFACFVDAEKIYIYREDTEDFEVVTDTNAPGNSIGTKPGYIAAFGNRITVSVADSSQFFLSVINLGGDAFDPASCFTIANAAVFAQEDGIIRQMGVLNNTLYIFTDYETGIWSNIPSVFSGTEVSFPWKKNSTYSFNFGIADPLSLDIDFGKMVWLAQNSDGLLQVMMSEGGQPDPISSEAVDVLFQRYVNKLGGNSPFLSGNASGFLYQYENKIFYRISGGRYKDAGILDQEQNANSIEYKFDTQTWHRCIELNGERCRIQRHIYFNNKHLVTVIGDGTIYDMSGQYYYNEVRNPNQSDPQAADAYLKYPFRYERITPIISQDDYSEFETQYAEIDMVFGDSNINFSQNPFPNTKFVIGEEPEPDGDNLYLIDENSGIDGEPVFVIADGTNTPSLDDTTYNYLYKPSVELFWSDDGGISFNSADVREFSQMGVYQWRMRWYQLGTSRNRVYKLIVVSPVPIVILGGTMMVRRISGGAN